MTKKEFDRDVEIHYNDGIAMNDHDGAIENIIGSAERYVKQQLIEMLEEVYDNHTESDNRYDFERYLANLINELKQE